LQASHLTQLSRSGELELCSLSSWHAGHLSLEAPLSIETGTPVSVVSSTSSVALGALRADRRRGLAILDLTRDRTTGWGLAETGRKAASRPKLVSDCPLPPQSTINTAPPFCCLIAYPPLSHPSQICWRANSSRGRWTFMAMNLFGLHFDHLQGILQNAPYVCTFASILARYKVYFSLKSATPGRTFAREFHRHLLMDKQKILTFPSSNSRLAPPPVLT